MWWEPGAQLELAPLVRDQGGLGVGVVLRLAGAVLVEAHDEWQATDRRYLGEATMALLNSPTPGNSSHP
jgi:hypothetical protein